LSPEPVTLALSLTVSLPPHIFERHLPSSPFVVGEHLADEVMRYVQANNLGYYPALEYFKLRDGIDKDLLETAEHISWFDCKIVKEELPRKLRPAFRDIAFDLVQTVAFTMPGVRPGQLNARHALAIHYTPDTVKIAMKVTARCDDHSGESVASWARQSVYRWLKDCFHPIEVTSVRALTPSAAQQHDE
jgi:hypothetical protein